MYMDYGVYEEDIKKILKTYKIERAQIEKLLQEKLAKDTKLLAVIETKNAPSEVARTAEYKRFIKDLKKDVYYGLRKYFQVPVADTNNFLELTKSHVSTKERLEDLAEFNKIFTKSIARYEHILDIGGGLYPLIFPFDKAVNLKTYTWIDKNKQSFETMNSISDALQTKNPTVEFRFFGESIGDRPWKDYLPAGVADFDLALMLKLIPVVQRQQRELIPLLLTVPAKSFLVTGSRYALTKNMDIEGRERKVIKDFIEKSGKNLTESLNTKNEFGYLLA